MREGVSSLNLATAVAAVLFARRLRDRVETVDYDHARRRHQRKDRSCLPLADINLGEALLLAFEIFFFVIWIWILITILTDLFRDHEISGWAKAAWVLFLVFIPFLTALIYLIARGSGMRDRTIKAQAEAKQHMDDLHPRAGPRLARRRAAQAQRAEGKGRPLGRGVREGEGEAAGLICNASCRLLATPNNFSATSLACAPMRAPCAATPRAAAAASSPPARALPGGRRRRETLREEYDETQGKLSDVRESQSAIAATIAEQNRRRSTR